MKKNLNWGLLSSYRTELYGIATLMIMIFHCQTIIPVSGIFNAVNIHLSFGVDVFLLLSGISLYFSYSKDGNYGKFIKKRCERTLLPYLLIALLYWIWKNLIAEFDILEFLYNISGLSLFLVRNDGWLTLGNPKIWYVSFIMLMYAVYPLIYKALFTVPEKRRKINLVLMLSASVIGAVFIRYYTPSTYAATEVEITRIPVFLIGCYLGKKVKENDKFTLSDYILFFSCIPIKLVISLFINPVTDDIVFHRYLGFFASFLICFAAVFVLETVKNIKQISKPLKGLLSFFGKMSLEIYITHVLMYNVVLYYFPTIRNSELYTFSQKIMIYAGILIISIVLSCIFRKITNVIIRTRRKQKNEIS